MLSELAALFPYETLLAKNEKALNDAPYSYLFIHLKNPRKRCSASASKRSSSHKEKKMMGAFLSQMGVKLLGDGNTSVENEVDHNACICCGTMTVTAVEREGTEEKEGAK